MPSPAIHYWSFLLSVSLFFAGCQQGNNSSGKSDTTEAPARPLHVMVTDDPDLAKAIAREWKSRAGTEITVENITTAQLLDSKRFKTDLVIYPPARLGDLVEKRLLLPLPKYVSKQLARHNKGLLPISRTTEVSWGAEQYAVSFGSPQLVLYYRRDIFTALKLEPPKTWQDYQQLVTTLSEREKVAPWLAAPDHPWRAASEPLGTGSAAATLLSRAAAYVRHPNQYSGLFDYLSLEPLIARPPFVRALEELHQATSSIPADQWPDTVDNTRQLFYQGKTAMAISWPSLAATHQQEETVNEEGSLGWTLLPGSREVYNASEQEWEAIPQQEATHVPLLSISGRLGSVSRNSSQPQFAAESLLRLTSSKWSTSISRLSPHTTMSRTSHLASATDWLDAGTSATDATQFTDAFRAASNSSRVMFCLRIPGRDRYLAALEEAILRVLHNQASASEALADASHQWEEITDQLGRQEQSRAYRQSLGLQP